MISQAQRKIILEKLSPFDPKRVAVFGSYARSENKKGSDLDLLVEFGNNITLFDIIGIEQELSEVLGIKVDLVTEAALSPYMRPYIEKDLKKLI